MTRHVIEPASAVPVLYRPLHAYLHGRFADSVVLTFAEIEDLLGVALPDPARLQQEWWTDERALADPSPPSPQSHAWTQASRTARANLRAGKVLFERVSG